jgi:hypothetical protein
MTEVDWAGFINTFDFDALTDAFATGSWKWILSDRIVWGISAVLICMLAYQPTRNLTATIVVWLAVGILYGIGGVVLKNSSVSDPGPFVILSMMFFGVVGYLVWTKLLH